MQVIQQLLNQTSGNGVGREKQAKMLSIVWSYLAWVLSNFVHIFLENNCYVKPSEI